MLRSHYYVLSQNHYCTLLRIIVYSNYYPLLHHYYILQQNHDNVFLRILIKLLLYIIATILQHYYISLWPLLRTITFSLLHIIA